MTVSTKKDLYQAVVLRLDIRSFFVDTLYEIYIIYYSKTGHKNYLHFCLDEPVYNSSQYRRKSVFAEAYNPEEDDGDDTKVRVNTMGERDQRG